MSALTPESPAAAPQRELPLLTRGSAWRARWQHNAVSAVAAPLNMLGRRAVAGSFGILMYHRVTPNPSQRFPPTYSVTPQRFEGQLRGLLRRGFSCWSLERALQANRTAETIPAKVFVITFDDGFANNILHALPILERLNLPATIFLATAYLDSLDPFPFDHWARGQHRSLPPESWIPMTRDQCHHALRSGLIQFGAHTHTHADFRAFPELLVDDLGRCCRVLSDEFDVENPPFSFPFGVTELGFADARFAAIARELECSCALRIDNRLATPADDPFAWPRFDVASGETGGTLAAKLNGWYECLRSGVRRLRRPLAGTAS